MRGLCVVTQESSSFCRCASNIFLCSRKFLWSVHCEDMNLNMMRTCCFVRGIWVRGQRDDIMGLWWIVRNFEFVSREFVSKLNQVLPFKWYFDGRSGLRIVRGLQNIVGLLATNRWWSVSRYFRRRAIVASLCLMIFFSIISLYFGKTGLLCFSEGE